MIKRCLDTIVYWFAGVLKARFDTRERTTRWSLVLFFKTMLLPIFLAMLLATVWLGILMGMTWTHASSNTNALFLLSAETSHLSFQTVEGAPPAPFYVQGVKIVQEAEPIKDTTVEEAGKDPTCISGWLEPLPGSRTEFLVLDGQQAARTEGPVLLANAETELTIGDEVPKANALMLDQTLAASDRDIELGGLTLDGVVQIRADPACFEQMGIETEAFASRQEPIFIEGPGQIGRQLRRSEGPECSRGDPECNKTSSLWALEERRSYLKGSIDILARQSICWRRFWLGGPCPGIVRLNADPVAMPAGASVAGGISKNALAPSILNGQVYFDGQMYQLDASTNANWITMTFPTDTEGGSASSELRLSLLDRLLTDAWILIAFTVCLTLLGWLLSILQIETHRMEDTRTDKETATNASNRRPPP